MPENGSEESMANRIKGIMVKIDGDEKNKWYKASWGNTWLGKNGTYTISNRNPEEIRNTGKASGF